jgi:hypothetical protein
VYHFGAVSSDQVWTERERLERCYRGGIVAYGMIHGPARARLYALAELLGTSVRWGAYAVASRVRRNDYFATQARFYGWLARFYLRAAWQPGVTSP